MFSTAKDLSILENQRHETVMNIITQVIWQYFLEVGNKFVGGIRPIRRSVGHIVSHRTLVVDSPKDFPEICIKPINTSKDNTAGKPMPYPLFVSWISERDTQTQLAAQHLNFVFRQYIILILTFFSDSVQYK